MFVLDGISWAGHHEKRQMLRFKRKEKKKNQRLNKGFGFAQQHSQSMQGGPLQASG